MKKCELLEYRPGYYAWVDAGGAVIRKATDAEADAHLAQLAGRAVADLDGGGAAHVAGLPLFAVENTPDLDGGGAQLPSRRRPSKGKAKPNGNGGGPAARLASDPAGQVPTEPTDQAAPSMAPTANGNGAHPGRPRSAAMASGNGDQVPEVVPEVVPTNGAGKMGSVDVPGAVFFVAYRDHGNRDGMIPTSQDGRLLVYPDLDAARADAGALGVGSAQRWPGIEDLCRRHSLALPEAAGNGDGHD